MKKIGQILMLAMLVWGNYSFATYSADVNPRQDLQTISSWMAHLNRYYPELQVSAAETSDLTDPAVRGQVMEELHYLEELMNRGGRLPDASLKQIACGRPECTGGGGGNCSTCQVD